jgi:hypothetical protein
MFVQRRQNHGFTDKGFNILGKGFKGEVSCGVQQAIKTINVHTESNIYISGKTGFPVKQHRLPPDNHIREAVIVET